MVAASLPAGIRITVPPYPISIGAEFTTTAAKLSRSLAITVRPFACRRRANKCGGVMPCRRATALTDLLPPELSTMIDALHVRCLPAPMKISSRRNGSDICVITVSDISPASITRCRTLAQRLTSEQSRPKTALTESGPFSTIALQRAENLSVLGVYAIRVSEGNYVSEFWVAFALGSAATVVAAIVLRWAALALLPFLFSLIEMSRRRW